MCSNVLRAARCNVLLCGAICCNAMLQCNVAVQCCGVLQFVAACCQVPRRGSKCAGHAWGHVQSRLAAVARLQFCSFLFIWLFLYNIGMHSHKYKGHARAMTTRNRCPPFFFFLVSCCVLSVLIFKTMRAMHVQWRLAIVACLHCLVLVWQSLVL